MPRARSKSPAAAKAGKSHPLRQLFDRADQDGNGVLDLGELKMIMASLNAPVSTKQAKQMMAEADIDGDGVIDFAEFFTIMSASLDESAWSTVQDAPTALLANIEMLKAAAEGPLEGFHRSLSAAGEPAHFVTPVPIVMVGGVFVKSQGAATGFLQPNICMRAAAFFVGGVVMGVVQAATWPFLFATVVHLTGDVSLANSAAAALLLLLNVFFWTNGQTAYHFLFGFQVVRENGAKADCCSMFMRQILSLLIPAAVFLGAIAVFGGAHAMAYKQKLLEGDVLALAQAARDLGGDMVTAAALSNLAAGLAIFWPCCSSKRRQLADECLGTQVVFKR